MRIPLRRPRPDRSVRTAVVTGAAGGLGRALVLDLVGRGATVLGADVDLAGLAETAHLAAAAGGTCHTQRCDVRDREQVRALRATAEALLGDVDLLVNNAGVGIGGRPVGAWDDDDWRWTIDVNLLGVAHGCDVFVPAMRERGSGCVVNVASAAGLVGAAGMAPYNATKAAVVALTETMAQELRGTGVGATVVCPFFFETGILASGRIDPAGADRAAKLSRMSRLDAAGVARATVDGALADRLYVLPHREIALVWLLKRLLPTTYVREVAARTFRLDTDRGGIPVEPGTVAVG